MLIGHFYFVLMGSGRTEWSQIQADIVIVSVLSLGPSYDIIKKKNVREHMHDV